MQACCLPSCTRSSSARLTPVVERVTPPQLLALDDIKFLSDDRLAGRMTGSPGADTAAAYLARRFEQVGPSTCGRRLVSDLYDHEGRAGGAARARGRRKGAQRVGLLPGRDPVLRNQAVIVGAHYDHLGLGGFGSLDPDSTGKVHNGADDNASGSAMLIQIAARLAASPPARTVIFIAFSGEELGLLGSALLCEEPIYPLATTQAMINLDMVGRLRQNHLIVYGSQTAREFPRTARLAQLVRRVRSQGAGRRIRTE